MLFKVRNFAEEAYWWTRYILGNIFA